MRENMLPVIEEFTGTEYSTAGFVLTAILLLLITGFAGYITGKSAAESFGGNKKKTAIVFTLVSVLTMAALLCFFGASAKAARGGVMCIIMLYAAFEDIKTRECADFLSVMLGITGIIGKEPKELFLSLLAFAGIILILLISSAVTKNGIGGGDVKLMAVAGLLIGWQKILLAFLLGCILGSVLHLLRMKVSGEGHVLAMGPYLAAGIFLAALFGERWIDWYLSLLVC